MTFPSTYHVHQHDGAWTRRRVFPNQVYKSTTTDHALLSLRQSEPNIAHKPLNLITQLVILGFLSFPVAQLSSEYSSGSKSSGVQSSSRTRSAGGAERTTRSAPRSRPGANLQTSSGGSVPSMASATRRPMTGKNCRQNGSILRTQGRRVESYVEYGNGTGGRTLNACPLPDVASTRFAMAG